VFHINIDKLNGKLVEKHVTKAALCKILGISGPTLKRYFDNPNCMPYQVIVGIAEVICDTASEAQDIFFVENLRGA